MLRIFDTAELLDKTLIAIYVVVLAILSLDYLTVILVALPDVVNDLSVVPNCHWR